MLRRSSIPDRCLTEHCCRRRDRGRSSSRAPAGGPDSRKREDAPAGFGRGCFGFREAAGPTDRSFLARRPAAESLFRFCFANSEYETGTGFEDRCHLACFVADKSEHDAIVALRPNRNEGSRDWNLRHDFVDHFFTCERWESARHRGRTG